MWDSGNISAVDTRPISNADVELTAFAHNIIANNGDGSVHTVAAAVRDTTGRMFGGINVYHFTGGPCAELVALGHARAEGARSLETIVAVGDGDRGVIGPCGRDRQVLSDYHPHIRALVPTSDGVRSIAISSLLPWGSIWSPETGTGSMFLQGDE